MCRPTSDHAGGCPEPLPKGRADDLDPIASLAFAEATAHHVLRSCNILNELPKLEIVTAQTFDS